jgi:hypothetical protein
MSSGQRESAPLARGWSQGEESRFGGNADWLRFGFRQRRHLIEPWSHFLVKNPSTSQLLNQLLTIIEQLS